MLGPTAVLFLATALSGDLTTAVKLSARPNACAAPSTLPGDSSSPGAWDEVRERGRDHLCRRLARIQIELASQPEQALRLAQELARELPDRAEPWTLQARAQVRLGAFAAAWTLWQRALQQGEELRAAQPLHDYAVSAAMTGHGELALASYRRLLPLLQAWPDPLDQQAIYVEAAVAALQRGPDGVEEAAGHLASARAGATSTGLRAYVAGLGALLALRRGGAAQDESRLDAPEVWHFVETVQHSGGDAAQGERWPRRWPVLPTYEVLGAAALLVEPYSDSVSIELWERHARGLEQAGAAERWRAIAAQRHERGKAPQRRAP